MIGDIIANEAHTPLHPHTLVSPKLMTLFNKHLHAHQHLNLPLSQVQDNHAWHSSNNAHAALGAHTGDIAHFLQHAITTIHHTTLEDTDYFSDLHAALIAAKPPRRIIIILPYETAMTEAHEHIEQTTYRAHILLTIQPNTLTLYNSSSLLAPSTEITMHRKLAVLLLDHNSAPYFHPPALQEDIESHFPDQSQHMLLHPPPWFQRHHTTGSFTSVDRDSPMAHPGLEFLTSQPTLHKHTHDDDADPSNGYTTITDPELLITFLGHPPNKLVHKLLRAAKHSPSAMTPDKHAYITTCLLATTLKAYTRLRNWRLQTLFGTQHIIRSHDIAETHDPNLAEA